MGDTESTNLILEQYGVIKRMELDRSPLHFLRDADESITMNRHQVLAFCRAVDALKNGGMILADEVGLGKTIEAGFVLEYKIAEGARYVLVIVPSSLAVQWKNELSDKFRIDTRIADRKVLDGSYSDRTIFKKWLYGYNGPRVVICSYGFAIRVIELFKGITWDFCIIDEAHNLRNAFNGSKRAATLFRLLRSIPKLLLTATPLQNRLEDIHGLISFIDEDIFLDQKTFLGRYGGEDSADKLREAIAPLMQRTLRKDVPEIHFSKRISKTFDFSMSSDEEKLYREVDMFLKRSWLYSIPVSNRGFVNLAIRKILSSSSFAVEETFKTLRVRLQYAYEDSGDKRDNDDEAFDFLLALLDDDEVDEMTASYSEEPEENEKRQKIKEEEEAIDSIIRTAHEIQKNSKIEALKASLESAFSFQRDKGIPQKAVIFTELRRTQEYIVSELLEASYDERDIIEFNGSISAERRQEAIDRFRKDGRIFISTDAGAEGLNLQFCNVIINYDLPWNPQKIEQRIGRCHRYGQKNDVVAISFLNRSNEADRRVYDILSEKFHLFDGIFGSSDSSLGLLESGVSFEKDILRIYQECNTASEFDREFDKLEKRIDNSIRKSDGRIGSILQLKTPEAAQIELDNTFNKVQNYIEMCRFWEKVPEPDLADSTFLWENMAWGERTVGSHGMLFAGSFCDGSELRFPFLVLLDGNWENSGFSEDEIIRLLMSFDDYETYDFKPCENEMESIKSALQRIEGDMVKRYEDEISPVIEDKKRRLQSLAVNRRVRLEMEIESIRADISECDEKISQAISVPDRMKAEREKRDLEKKLSRKTESYDKHLEYYRTNSEKMEEEFRRSLELKCPILIPKIILRF